MGGDWSRMGLWSLCNGNPCLVKNAVTVPWILHVCGQAESFSGRIQRAWVAILHAATRRWGTPSHLAEDQTDRHTVIQASIWRLTSTTHQRNARRIDWTNLKQKQLVEPTMDFPWPVVPDAPSERVGRGQWHLHLGANINYDEFLLDGG